MYLEKTSSRKLFIQRLLKWEKLGSILIFVNSFSSEGREN